MPLEGLRTFTNMGGKVCEDETWNKYEHECKPAKSALQPFTETSPGGRGQDFNQPEPKTVEKSLATGKTTKKRSHKPTKATKSVSAEADKKLQEANKADIKKRNITPKTNDNN